jgi:hypothetical protein
MQREVLPQNERECDRRSIMIENPDENKYDRFFAEGMTLREAAEHLLDNLISYSKRPGRKIHRVEDLWQVELLLEAYRRSHRDVGEPDR